MKMSDLYSAYQTDRAKNDAERALVWEKGCEHARKATRLKQRAEEEDRKAVKLMEKANAMPKVTWEDRLVRPLAEELSRRSAKKNFTIIGPGGLSCATHIVLHDDPEYVPLTRREETYLELTVQPDDQDGVITLRYETGEDEDVCPKGSIGQVGGLNRVTKPLPDSIEEIEKLLREAGPMPKIIKVIRFEGDWPSDQNTHTVVYEDGSEHDYGNFASLPGEVTRFMADADDFGFGYKDGRYCHFFAMRN